MRIPQSEIDRIKRDVSVEQFLVNPKRQGASWSPAARSPATTTRRPASASTWPRAGGNASDVAVVAVT